MSLLLPKLYLESIYDLDIEELKDINIKGIILDIDNTLIPWDKHEVDDKLRQWINNLLQEQFKICFVSNNSATRVLAFSKHFNLPAFHKCYKPRKRPFLMALEKLDTNINNTAIIGDQIFTDILGGNRLGIYTILVKPLGTKEDLKTSLIRNVERIILGKSKLEPKTQNLTSRDRP